MSADLFGTADMPMSETRKLKNRLANRPRGHAWTPGTGPEGETCGSCRHQCWKPNVAGHFPKCRLTEARWTGTRRTDIRLRDPACKFWEARP